MYELWQAVNLRMDKVLGAGTGSELRALATKVASPDFLAAMKGD